jgi:signal transduction histidine kinase
MANSQEQPLTLEDAVDLVWDVCEEVFDKDGKFHSWFISDIEQYFRFLIRSFAQVLANPNGQPIGGIGTILKSIGVDRVAIHYRSRRAKEDESSAWQRTICDLGEIKDKEPRTHDNNPEDPEPPHLDRGTYYQGKTLPQHIFKKGKRNRILCFEFVRDEQNDIKQEESADGKEEFLQIPFSVYQKIIKFLDNYQQDNSLSEIINEIKAVNGHFLTRLAEYCQENLLEDSRPQNEQERIQFLIDSSLITLTLLKEGKIHLPRAFLLAPVFVGQEGTGGIAFFGKDRKQLQDNRRELKYLAINLLSYISMLESHEIEAEKRLLEATSPVVHFFVHSVNKAFTTPVQNICTEIAKAANLMGEISYQVELKTEANRSSQRLQAIESFLSSFSKRWSGTFAALASQPQKSNGLEPLRFLWLDDFDSRGIKEELSEQIEALFAVQLANDIYDFSEFSKYRPIFESLNGLKRIVDLRFNLQGKIWANKAPMLLYLADLVQNAIEALPLSEILWKYRDEPESLLEGSSYLRIDVNCHEREDDVLIEVCDNGSGFKQEIRDRLNGYLNKFSRLDFPPATLEGILQEIKPKESSLETPSQGLLSTKSGGALGQGILGLADYVSRICLVEWDRPRPGESDYPDDRAIIKRRGKVEIESPRSESQSGSIIRILLPKVPDSRRDPKKSQRVFVQRRG